MYGKMSHPFLKKLNSYDETKKEYPYHHKPNVFYYTVKT